MRPLRLLFLALVCTAAAACSSDEPPPQPGFGTLRVTMQSTASGRADNVWVTFDRVEARHETMGWLVVDESVRAVDLESLGAVSEISEILGLRNLPTGSYTGVRLRIRDTAVMVGGSKRPLTIPIDSPDGIELAADFVVSICGVVEVGLSWDVAGELEMTTSSTYTLRPAISLAPSTTNEGCCEDRLCANALIIHDAEQEWVSGYFGKDEMALGFLAETSGNSQRVVVSSATGEILIEVSWEGTTYRTSLLGGAAVTTIDLAILEQSQHLATLPPDQIPPFSVAAGISTTGDPAAADQLVARPDYALLPFLSRSLGEAGLNGADYPITLPLHRMGMQAAVDLQIDPTIGFMPRTPPPGSIAAGMCLDLRPDPNDDDCFGLCGPGCSCWEWACGDCCCHAGCASHDSTCRNCKWYKPWNCALCYTFTSFLAGGCGSCGGGGAYEPPCSGIGGTCSADHECCGYGNGASEYELPLLNTVYCYYDASGGGSCREEGEPIPSMCGDGYCTEPETCSSCDLDCGACPSSCNANGVCDGFPEDCTTCPGDCPCPIDSACAAGRCYGCGDAVCDPAENCGNCVTDCGVCPPCGDGVCAPGEDCSICPADCGCPGGLSCSAGVCVGCGNGSCESGESCGNCPGDCGVCPPGDPCGDGACAGEDCTSCPADCGGCPPGPSCGDGACTAGDGETCGNCPADCGGCVGCGDGTCGGGEDCASCPADCGGCAGCGSGTCDGYPEDCGTCPGDCPCPGGTTCVERMCTCGDGACNGGEDCGNCPGDCPCPTCGDAACNGGEDCASCPGDCGSCGPYCGDGACEPFVEGCGNCPGDCPCWMPDTVCIGGMCVLCGNGTCDGGEYCDTCPGDCGSCGPYCGDGTCDWPEDGCSCDYDCGPCIP